MPPLTIEFAPPRALRNPHLQSILASTGPRRWFARRGGALESGAREHLLDCGDGVRLQGFHTAQTAAAQARGLVVLLHGWEGSARSTYMLRTGERLLAEGFDVFRLNFRDHGDTHHLNRELFHSCRIEEVVGAVGEVSRRFRPTALAVAGYSLGGNFALRVALRAPAAGIELAQAVAVCPVVSPRAGLYAIEGGPRFYERYFLHKWRESLRRKQRLFPDAALFTASELGGNLRELTRAMVLRHTGFDSLESYLEGYSLAGEALTGMQVPTAILTAADDPVIPVADFHALTLSAQVRLDIAPHGGHCGFLADFALRSFAEDYIAQELLARTG
jgi:predicted alpha/beta-fold hydrolase